MDWKYIKPLKSDNLISEYETLVDYTFDDAFKNCIRMNNGGRPSKKCFDTDSVKERKIKTLLSLNHDDMETVWKTYNCLKCELGPFYVPFANDNLGNVICFDKKTGNVIFINSEMQSVELISNSFTEFINKLY